MANKLLVPTQKALRATMEMMYGEEVKVGGDAPALEGNPVCAIYVTDDDTPIATVLCDVAFAAYAGASLSMIPAGGAQDAATSGELTDGMFDNLQEVMNICSNLFMDDNTPHLRLGSVYRSLNEVPPEARAVVDSVDGPAFTVDIPRYGSGVVRMMS